MTPADCEPLLPGLGVALHPLHRVPSGEAWNVDELAGLVETAQGAREAAVLVPLVRRDEVRVLLTRRTDGLRHHGGQVSFPGGRIDPGDDGPVDAALREAGEEIGLPRDDARPVGYLDPLQTITGFRVQPVVAWIAPAFVPRLQPGEVAAVFEVPLAWLMAPENLLRTAIDIAGRRREVLEFRRHDGAPTQRIWGATASILLNLRQRIAGMA